MPHVTAKHQEKKHCQWNSSHAKIKLYCIRPQIHKDHSNQPQASYG